MRAHTVFSVDIRHHFHGDYLVCFLWVNCSSMYKYSLADLICVFIMNYIISSYCQILHKINDAMDILYTVTGPQAGGMVSCRLVQ